MGVNGRSINVQGSPPSQNLIATKGRAYNDGTSKQMVTANLGSGPIGPASSSVQGFWASSYQYYTTGIIPADPHLIDTSTLALFYRDLYFFDNVAGSCVDIKSRFPYSKFDLRGLEDKEMRPYHEALEQLNLQQMMPTIATANMVDGFFCGSLVFDARTKRFLDTLMHDALSCAVIPSPFWNIDPTINVRVGQATQQFMHDTSEYARRYLQSMPSQFIDMLRSGAFTLDPVTTLFVPRRSTTDRAYTSYLHRLLPMYLIEKTLFRGTLVEAQRRQRAMTHLTAGDDTWTPTGEELLALVEQFQAAEYDPLGGWVSTRSAVQAVDLRPGGDFWKWTDMGDILTPYKMRALGVSEALLSGDASFASAECLVGDTLITQEDGTTITIESMCPVPNVEPSSLIPGEWHPLDTSISNRISKSAKIRAWAYKGYKDTFKVTTAEGHEVTATDNHPFFVLQADGTTCWKCLDELKVGDKVAVAD